MTDTTLALGYVHPGHVDAHFMQSVVNTLANDSQREKPRILRGGSVIAVGSGPRIAEARNTVVSNFLGLPNQPEWLLMLDTDMVFSPDAVDKILDAADPEGAPIVGGLCFGGGRSGIMFPTMYVLKKPEHANDNPVQIVEDYPEDTMCQVHATGAAFLLMHRSVLAKMGEIYKDSPYPWFLEGSVYANTKFGEDWAFCMRAIEAGFPIYVHTGVKIGHVKPQVLDEDAWLAFKAKKAEVGEAAVAQTFKEKIMGHSEEKPVKIPTYVVIPQKGKVDMTCRLLGQLAQQGDVEGIYVFDNGSTLDEFRETEQAAEKAGAELIGAAGKSIHEMWNEGVARILKDAQGPVNIAVLNNDLRIGPHFLLRLSTALRADKDLVAVCPNYDGRRGNSGVQYVVGTTGMGGMSGFAFMFRGELFRDEAPFDEGFGWWYGDDDFALRIMDSGKKVGLVLGASVEHLDGGSQTAGDIDPESEMGLQITADRTRFAEKHGFSDVDGKLIRAGKEMAA